MSSWGADVSRRDQAFQSFEAEVEGVPIDEDGLAVDELERLLAAGGAPKLLYTIPDFQNPAGVTLSAERREALVELARRKGLLLVEDVAYRELRYEGEAPPTLLSLGPDVVLQAGTFSKTFFPGVRLGWAAGPAEPRLQARLGQAEHRPVRRRARPTPARGVRTPRVLDEQIARARGIYRSRKDTAMSALGRHVGDRATWTRPQGGFFTWLDVETTVWRSPRAPSTPARCARRPSSAAPRGERNIRISYSQATEERLEEGIALLGPILNAQV